MNTPATPVTVTFWGVRGSIPTPVPDNLAFGGNTACLEIRCGSEVLLIDAGTGIRACGNQFAAQPHPPDITVLLSHFHWDHLIGLPFFAPLYRPGCRLRFVASIPRESIRSHLQGLMRFPYFPVDWEQTASQKEYLSIPGNGVGLGPFHVEPIPLNHPQGATGYRIHTPAGWIVYASDFEHGDQTSDDVLLKAIADARILIYDAQYTPEDYEATRRGWGHSTWKEAVCFARKGNVDRLVLFHHDPNHTDTVLAGLQTKAREMFSNTDVATEGTSITIR